jgi:hypothetical protein
MRNGIITIFALILGPLLALGVSWYADKRKFKKDRQLKIFQILIKRPIRNYNDIDREFAESLNLVYVDFVDHPKVIEARKHFQEFVTHTNSQHFEQGYLVKILHI